MNPTTKVPRRLAQGAEVYSGGVHFRIWAPLPRKVAVVIPSTGDVHALVPEEHGYWSLSVPGLGSGTRYQYRLDDDPQGLPDPASRSQPDGITFR